jgi:Cytochrome c7 and related cytochrome c
VGGRDGGRVGAIFSPRSNLVAKLAVIGLLAIPVGGVGWWWLWPRTDYVRHVGWVVDQPVLFSHQHHVAGLGIDCRYCHTAVERSADAGMPATHTCMTCHSQVWTNAKLLAPVRDSLANNTPIVWHRVNDLPDYVYFNHSIHVAKGIGCQSCHGHVDGMALSYKASTFTMGFCLSCHRDPAPHLRPLDQITNTEWHRSADTPSPQTLMAEYHISVRDLTDCSICHR